MEANERRYYIASGQKIINETYGDLKNRRDPRSIAINSDLKIKIEIKKAEVKTGERKTIFRSYRRNCQKNKKGEGRNIRFLQRAEKICKGIFSPYLDRTWKFWAQQE